MLKYSVSRIIAMNVFGCSQAGNTKKIISDIQTSYKTIQNEIKLQQKEIDSLKSNITHLLSLEIRVSELFNNYLETNTQQSFIIHTIDSVKTEIDRITGIFDENSLPNHGSYISDLNYRLKIIEENYIKKN